MADASSAGPLPAAFAALRAAAASAWAPASAVADTRRLASALRRWARGAARARLGRAAPRDPRAAERRALVAWRALSHACIVCASALRRRSSVALERAWGDWQLRVDRVHSAGAVSKMVAFEWQRRAMRAGWCALGRRAAERPLAAREPAAFKAWRAAAQRELELLGLIASHGARSELRAVLAGWHAWASCTLFSSGGAGANPRRLGQRRLRSVLELWRDVARCAVVRASIAEAVGLHWRARALARALGAIRACILSDLRAAARASRGGVRGGRPAHAFACWRLAVLLRVCVAARAALVAEYRSLRGLALALRAWREFSVLWTVFASWRGGGASLRRA